MTYLIDNNLLKNFNSFFFYKKKIITFNNFFLLFIFKNYFITHKYSFKFLIFYKKNWFKIILNYNFYNYNLKIPFFYYKSLTLLNDKNQSVTSLNFSLNSNFSNINKNYKNLIFKNAVTSFITLINFKFIYLFMNFFKKFTLFNFYFNYNIYTYISNYNFKFVNTFSIQKSDSLQNNLRLKKNLNLLYFNYNLI